jgi:hypothetical protein
MIKLSKIEGQDKIISRARQICHPYKGTRKKIPENHLVEYIEALDIAEEEYKDGSE